MFFIMGISTGEKKFEFLQTILCSRCGKYGRYEVFMTYTFFSLFFIPLFKWNRNYFVKSTCCNTMYRISPELGRKIADGSCSQITEDDLELVSSGNPYTNKCPFCGFDADSSFDYCPKCGNKL